MKRAACPALFVVSLALLRAHVLDSCVAVGPLDGEACEALASRAEEGWVEGFPSCLFLLRPGTLAHGQAVRWPTDEVHEVRAFFSELLHDLDGCGARADHCYALAA